MKLFSVLAGLLTMAITANAQQTPVLKQKYQPKHTYSINNKNAVLMQIAVQSDSTAKVTGGNGVEKVEMKTLLEDNTDLKTEQAQAAKSMSIAISRTYVTSRTAVNNNEQVAPPDVLAGRAINGTIDADGKVSLDTTKTEADIKAAIKSLAGGLPAAIAFPERPLKVGDTFTAIAPGYELDLTNQGIKKDFSMNVTYKLTDIKDNQAIFETNGEFDISYDTAYQGRTIKVSGKGGGPGKMVFDIAKSFPQYIASQINVAFEVRSEKAKADFKTTMWHETKIVVKAD